MLGTASEKLHAQLPDLRRSKISVQVAVVQGRKPVDILGYEIGGVEARVNEERITKDDFAAAGGAFHSGCLVVGFDVQRNRFSSHCAKDATLGFKTG